jgi:hypothetical protein
VGENAYLVLGCYGRTDDGFVLCASSENRILKLDETLNDFDSIMDYLESVGLMDKPMLDLNAIRHLVHNIQDRYDQVVRRLWTEKQYRLIERFIHMHKPCGLYARLILVPEELDTPKEGEPSSYVVKGVPESNTSEKTPELRLVRGRR